MLFHNHMNYIDNGKLVERWKRKAICRRFHRYDLTARPKVSKQSRLCTVSIGKQYQRASLDEPRLADLVV